MTGDLERLPVPVSAVASGAGPALLAAELLTRIRAELPVVGELGDRQQVLVSAWLTGLRSARTRRAYAGDVVAWLGWLAERGTDVLAAGRVHVDLWAATQLDAGAAASSVRRRLSALSSFYRYCAAHDLAGRVPTQGVARPVVDPDYTATVGLDRDQARALVAAADADTGAQALRTAAVVRLLLHNALRVDEACAADIADLGEDSGHRVLRVVRKGGRKAKIPLTPATVAALEAYLADRARRAGATDWRQLGGPLLATAAGGRLRQAHLWELVRRLARTAGIGAWAQLSPHSLRHSAITFALDAGASLRDVQDYAGHKDPRTTRRYDHSRDSLDRNAAYTVAAYLA
jgi:integrase/recombinase XerD